MACVATLPLEAEAWLHKSTAVVRQQAGRTREGLVDYANALLLADFHAEQSRAAKGV